MAVRELSAMTWEEVAALEADRTVAILPVGATEAHGPHLPLGTDVLIAQAMARAGATRLDAAGLQAVVLPPLAYSPAPFAAGFAGTIGLSSATMTAIVTEIALSLDARGIRVLAIANAHLDPAHLGALHAAADALPNVVFPDITRRPLGARLTDEFRSGACHAGQYETSIIMAAAPSLVREDSRRDLPAVMTSLSTAIRDGLDTFEAAGGERAYFGAPALATADEGQRTIAVLGDILAEAVLQMRAAL